MTALPPSANCVLEARLPHVRIKSCQAPGFVQRMAVNPARSGRKQR